MNKLFAITRYKENESSVDKETEEKRLEDLLQKIKKRKEIKNEKRLKSKSIKKKKKDLPVEEIKGLEEQVADLDLEEDAQIQDEPIDPLTSGFTILGPKTFNKIRKVKAALPKWLANPTVISMTLDNENLENVTYLSETLIEKLKENNVDHLFPVQKSVIPWILNEYRNSLIGFWPRDICVSAPTGSGKTLAFVLPIIQILSSRLFCQLRALVVLPTQDLATQVFKVFEKYSCNLNIVLATGQGSIEKEQKALVRSDLTGDYSLADILVTTPGRLVHHLRDTKGFTLKHLRFLIVDEADRVMDGAQSNWLHFLDKHLATVCKNLAPHLACKAPELTIANMKKYCPPPQKLLFSATITHDPEKLEQFGLFEPKLFACINTDEENDMEMDVSSHLVTPRGIKEYGVVCENEGAKPLLLHCLCNNMKNYKILCFTATKLAAHRLTLILTKLAENCKSAVKVCEISAELPLMMRLSILQRFTGGKINVLISSDALSRGIDISDIDCVISYDVPELYQLYVHRVGRTGRAGKKGTAITIVSSLQKGPFENMLHNAGKQLLEYLEPPAEQMQDLEEIYSKSLINMKKTTMVEKKNEIKINRKKKTSVMKLKNRNKRLRKNGKIKK